MKAYKPEALVAVSRYQDYFPTLDQQILTSIALYEVLQKHGKSETEAEIYIRKELQRRDEEIHDTREIFRSDRQKHQ